MYESKDGWVDGTPALRNLRVVLALSVVDDENFRVRASGDKVIYLIWLAEVDQAYAGSGLQRNRYWVSDDTTRVLCNLYVERVDSSMFIDEVANGEHCRTDELDRERVRFYPGQDRVGNAENNCGVWSTNRSESNGVPALSIEKGKKVDACSRSGLINGIKCAWGRKSNSFSAGCLHVNFDRNIFGPNAVELGCGC